MTNVTKEYVPGVCNIGPVERRARMRIGWMGLAVTALLWIILIVLRTPALWGLLLFLPATSGATGFLQAGLHFCAGFGIRGVFNFGKEQGKTETVEQAEFRRLDRAKAIRIGLYSALIGAAITIAAVLFAL